MFEHTQSPFLTFLAKGTSDGGFETDDVLGAVIPLMREVVAVHELGLVAPLDGLADIGIKRDKESHDTAPCLSFDAARSISPKFNNSTINRMQSPVSRSLEIVAETRRTSDLDQGTLSIDNLLVEDDEDSVEKPAYLPGYRCWEHAVGHHDELTDIYSIGLLMASLALGLDFTDTDDLDIFASSRENLFTLNRRLNPTIASVIIHATELNRHNRAQDLRAIITRLENYREQPVELDFDQDERFQKSGTAGKRRIIQSHLRDRLFEVSRRNRMIYFKPSLQSLNMTVASVPLLLDHRNIRADQLFTWQGEVAKSLSTNTAINLGKYLRFDDAPYIPGVLDKIASEARRSRAEFGFGQLRIVLCFLRWHNLKEEPDERIASPLLLLPVELTKKKGIRDNYVLEPTTTEAEVNPALRYYLKDLYDIRLPEIVDLRESSIESFYSALKDQIAASESAVTLNLIDRPQIELIHDRARQRLDQYQKRIKIGRGSAISSKKPDYSYGREDLRPLGLQLFQQLIRPAVLPLSDTAGAAPRPRTPFVVESNEISESGVTEIEQPKYTLREGGSRNPYSWDFDLCSLTLGNFNYRKMTLVRDYARLIETDMASEAFDSVFSLSPRPHESTPPPAIELTDQYLVIPCDAAQASAIARVRTGASYIIQGPPGTGKSQTITNLIADYVARGNRVLFVCEKRAAIDVVFHRLRQEGLDQLCCLIHDSQADKKAFIQNLKQTYEMLLASPEDTESDVRRTELLRSLQDEIETLNHFSSAMTGGSETIGIPLIRLIRRLVEISGHVKQLPPDIEEMLPEYAMWLRHGEVVRRLRTALAEIDESVTCFSEHPLHWLGNDPVTADRPLDAVAVNVERAQQNLNAVKDTLKIAGIADSLWKSYDDLRTLLGFAAASRRLAERRMIAVLQPGDTSKKFSKRTTEINKAAAKRDKAREKTAGWTDPLSPEDTETALALAKSFEASIFRYLLPAYWQLRKTMTTRYNFRKHAVTPTWSKVLGDLHAFHQADAACEQLLQDCQDEWDTDDALKFAAYVESVQQDVRIAHPSIKALIRSLAESGEQFAISERLSDTYQTFLMLDETLNFLLADFDGLDLPVLANVLTQVQEQTSALYELIPALRDLAGLPPEFQHAVRAAPLPLQEFEGAIGNKSVNSAYREDRAVSRFDNQILADKLEKLRLSHTELLSLNAKSIRAAVHSKFVDHVNVSSQTASQLDSAQKIFKKTYSAGRRELEHEFGKTMRYKSIRDLVADHSGAVIQDLKPIWMMSPLSVSDTLPLDPNLFDVVIFDEASQIPVEEAIPAIYRSNQAIVVGDEMQLPPTSFFASSRSDDETVLVEEEGEQFHIDLESDSFLNQSSRNLPSTLLAWHYRSRYEALISFSNAAYYSGNLCTIPDRQRAVSDRPELLIKSPEEAVATVDTVLERSISYHLMTNGVYDERRNASEAAYVAHLVRGLLDKNTGLSIGIVAFSEAQQSEIEDSLRRLADQDSAFNDRLEAEYVREENDQFCGLFVKNLENVQGDERDIIILSVCYGRNPAGKMLMNFGPINQRGGEKRLNVIFSRAKHHMAVISSIQHKEITNEYNDGANSLKNFLDYAQSVSRGDAPAARRVLENMNPNARKSLAPPTTNDAAVETLAAALRSRGLIVDTNVGQSKFRCDLAVRTTSSSDYQLCILMDTEAHYANPNLLDRYLIQPSILQSFGWRFAMVLTKDWYHTPDDVLGRIERLMRSNTG